MRREYIKAESITDALLSYRDDPENSRYLTGGTELLNDSPGIEASRVIDVRKFLGRMVNVVNTVLTIDAGASFQDIADCPDVPAALRDGCMNAQSRTLRCMASIGGNIAAARNDSYLIPVLAAYRAQLIVFSLQGNESVVTVEQYLSGHASYQSSLISKVIIPDVTLPVLQKRHSRSSQGKASVTVSVSLKDEVFAAASAEGCGYTRLSEVEKYAGEMSTVCEDDVISLVKKDFIPKDDFTGSAAYKQYLSGVTVTQLLLDLMQKGGN